MKKTLLLALAMFAAVSLHAQTTYTTTQDGCGGHLFQSCFLTADSGGQPFQILYMNSSFSTGPQASITIDTLPFPGTLVVPQTFGQVSGFTPNPDGTRNPYNGTATFESNDGSMTASFDFYAYYVSRCGGGRGGCSVIGWHYRVLAGSTVTVQ
jgi:hypothetical protein